MIAPDSETKLCWNAFSVSVFVFAPELAKTSSMAAETDAASFGLSICTIYHPTISVAKDSLFLFCSFK